MTAAHAFDNLLEPPGLVGHFLAHPPAGFDVGLSPAGMPWFSAEFDVLTTADSTLRRRIAAWPGYRRWGRWLRWRTRFAGTTVSEYMLLPRRAAPAQLVQDLLRAAPAQRLTIVKDLPLGSPLLADADNRRAESFAVALQRAGFVLLKGQALAWVPIDFASIDAYLARLSSGRRKDLRRKLRSRAALDIEVLPTGPAFADAALRAECFAMYEAVYAQSEIHFDRLGAAFFDAVLQDAGSGGRMFMYRHAGALIGWNLCFETGGCLVDKYIGLRYPAAREHNLYFVSWIVNLEHALAHGLKRYIAGWTDPQVKAELGAQFTFTRHAVRPRAAPLRWLLRRIAGLFESDGAVLAQRGAKAGA